MSSIASPRESIAGPIPRRISSNPLTTPTSSTRPSLEMNRSVTGSPNPSQLGGASSHHPGSMTSSPSSSAQPTFQPPTKRANRTALREYYNLKKAQQPLNPPGVEVTDTSTADETPSSEIPFGELDAEGFDAEAYANKLLADCSLEDLLKIYARVLGEMRALDAEKKALIYDNYSKLISATETIQKMRTNMDPLNPMASTLDPTISKIYSQAYELRESLRKQLPSQPSPSPAESEQVLAQRRKTKRLARIVLGTPERLRALLREGRFEDAKTEWELPRQLLVRWRDQGLGGDDVAACIAEGDAVLQQVSIELVVEDTDQQQAV